jgi:hypothetical protein
MHSRLTKGTLIVIGWQLIAPALAQADDSLLKAGQRYFDLHEYSSAEEFFRVASQSQPPSAEAHYWYATTLAKRFRGSDAVIEYQRCLDLNPSPLMASYCRAALAGYGVAANSKRQGVPVRQNNLVEDKRAGDAASASARIQDQVDAERSRLHNIGQFAANEKQQEGALFAARYLARGNSVTQELLKKPPLERPTTTRINQIDIYYKEMADRETRMANDSAAAINREYQNRQNALSDSANSLQEQLSAAPTAHTTTLLQPLGTNIYVRNYEPIGPLNDDDDIIIPPMKARAEKFNPQKSTEQPKQP